jgi:hypothetical protein
MKSSLYWNPTQSLDNPLHRDRHRHNRHHGRSLMIQFHDTWQMMIAQLSLSPEPRVWPTQDTLGRAVWSGYDPATGRSIQRVSAQEMQVWLEGRY